MKELQPLGSLGFFHPGRIYQKGFAGYTARRIFHLGRMCITSANRVIFLVKTKTIIGQLSNSPGNEGNYDAAAVRHLTGVVEVNVKIYYSKRESYLNS